MHAGLTIAELVSDRSVEAAHALLRPGQLAIQNFYGIMELSGGHDVPNIDDNDSQPQQQSGCVVRIEGAWQFTSSTEASEALAMVYGW